MRASVPNALSVSRVASGAFVILIAPRVDVTAYMATVVVVAGAMATDFFDGYLARRWHAESPTGYVLDAMGDRAIHLALVLAIVVRYQLPPVVAWLLIFRDMAIYAIRVLSKDWFRQSRQLRWISVLHASNLRVWIALFLVRDGFRVFTGRDVLDTAAFHVTHVTLLSTTILISYYGLLKSCDWLIDRQHSGA